MTTHTPLRPSGRTRALRAAAALAAIGLLTTACSSGEADSSSESSASEPAVTSSTNPSTASSGPAASDTTQPAEGGWTVDAVLIDCDAADVDPKTCSGPGTIAPYTALSPDQVTKDWDICATVPSLQDPVWVGVNYGMASEAERLRSKLSFFDAGGYENIAEQNSQVEDCIAQGADAVIIGAVSADALGPAIKAAKDAGVVVIDGGNGIASEDVTARAVLDYYDMGRSVGEQLVKQNKPMKVVLIPGPAGAGWSERSVVGFKDAIDGSQVELLEVKYGDPVKEVQTGLVEDTLSAHPDLDAIVGTGVTVDVGAVLLKERGLTDQVALYSTYISPSIIDLLKSGGAACAPNDQGVVLAKTMVDLAVRSLEGIPYVGGARRAAPAPTMVCGPAAGADDNIDSFDPGTTSAPADWSPVSQVG